MSNLDQGLQKDVISESDDEESTNVSNSSNIEETNNSSVVDTEVPSLNDSTTESEAPKPGTSKPETSKPETLEPVDDHKIKTTITQIKNMETVTVITTKESATKANNVTEGDSLVNKSIEEEKKEEVSTLSETDNDKKHTNTSEKESLDLLDSEPADLSLMSQEPLNDLTKVSKPINENPLKKVQLNEDEDLFSMNKEPSDFNFGSTLETENNIDLGDIHEIPTEKEIAALENGKRKRESSQEREEEKDNILEDIASPKKKRKTLKVINLASKQSDSEEEPEELLEEVIEEKEESDYEDSLNQSQKEKISNTPKKRRSQRVKKIVKREEAVTTPKRKTRRTPRKPKINESSKKTLERKNKGKLNMPLKSSCAVESSDSLELEWFQASTWDKGKAMMKNLRLFQNATEFHSIVRVCHHIFHFGVERDETERDTKAKVNFFSIKTIWREFFDESEKKLFINNQKDLANELMRMKFDTTECLKYVRIPSACSTTTFNGLLSSLEEWLIVIAEKKAKEQSIRSYAIQVKEQPDLFIEQHKVFKVDEEKYSEEDKKRMLEGVSDEDREIVKMSVLYESFGDALEHAKNNFKYFIPALTICEAFIDEYHKAVYFGTCGTEENKYRNYSVVAGYFSETPIRLDAERVHYSFKKHHKIHDSVHAIYWDSQEITFEETVHTPNLTEKLAGKKALSKQLNTEFYSLLVKLKNNEYDTTYSTTLLNILENAWNHPYWKIFRKTPKSTAKFSRAEDNFIDFIEEKEENILVCNELIFILSLIFGRRPSFVKKHRKLAKLLRRTKKDSKTILEAEFVDKYEMNQDSIVLSSFDHFWINRIRCNKKQEEQSDEKLHDVISKWKSISEEERRKFESQQDKMKKVTEKLVTTDVTLRKNVKTLFKKSAENCTNHFNHICSSIKLKEGRKLLSLYEKSPFLSGEKSKTKEILKIVKAKMEHYSKEMREEHEKMIESLVVGMINEYDEPITWNYLEKIESTIEDEEDN